MILEGFEEIFLGGFEIWDLVKNGGWFCLDFLYFCFFLPKKGSWFWPSGVWDLLCIWMCSRDEEGIFFLSHRERIVQSTYNNIQVLLKK